MNDAIKKAIEDGYKKGPYWWPIPTEQGITLSGDDQDKEYLTKEQILLDPEFWKALGKALGWEETLIDQPRWKKEAHNYLEIVLSGWDTEKFWKELLGTT